MKKIKSVKKTRSAPLTSTVSPHNYAHLNEFVREVAGDEGLKIITCIGGEEVTDEKIEQNTQMKIAEIRSVLNHLHSYGLVEYRREKNMQTGWFTYTWKLNPNRALQNFITIKKKEYNALKVKLEQGDGAQIYRCQKQCKSLEFENAMEFNFRCPSCNCRLNIIDQEDELKKLEHKITILTNMYAPPVELIGKPTALGEKLTSFGR
ncbi:MAG: hypothetical protein V1644_00220 [Candidatus Micrarchaeota archaeon]